jgi:hypothetical protein
MALDVVRRRAEVQAESIEEHHGDVDATVTRGHHAVAEPVEVRLVETGQVEPRLAVGRRAGPGSRPRLGCHAQMEAAAGRLGPEVFPTPEPDEVVPALGEEV